MGGVVTRPRAARSGVRIHAGARDFSLQKRPDWLWAPRSPKFIGYRLYFPEVKRLGREAEHPQPSSAEIKNEWSCTSSPSICLHGTGRDNIFIIWKWNGRAWTGLIWLWLVSMACSWEHGNGSCGSINVANLLRSWRTVSFSRRTLPHGGGWLVR